MRSALAFSIFTIFFLTSCGSKHPGEKKPTLASHFLSITDNEDKGIKDVIGIYGGECEYGFSKSGGINAEKKDAFWLEVRKSDAIDNSKMSPELIASNIAYLFYRNLKEEKNKYTEIQVKVKRSDGQTLDPSFPTATLELVKRRREVVDKIYSYIENKDFKSLSDHLQVDRAFTDTPKEKIVNGLMQVENTSSPVKELIPYGFRFVTLKDGREVLYFAGILLRQKENDKNPFSVVLDPKSNDDKIYFLNYAF